jgi:hypothetical protein
MSNTGAAPGGAGVPVVVPAWPGRCCCGWSGCWATFRALRCREEAEAEAHDGLRAELKAQHEKSEQLARATEDARAAVQEAEREAAAAREALQARPPRQEFSAMPTRLPWPIHRTPQCIGSSVRPGYALLMLQIHGLVITCVR